MTTDTDLFVEVFPIAAEAVPQLAAYTIEADLPARDRARLGARFAAQVRRSYDGTWRWIDDRLVTDAPRSAVELAIIADALRADQPERFAALGEIAPDTAWQPDAAALADFVIRTRVAPLREQMAQALSKAETRLRNARVEREHRLAAWGVQGEPALSLTIASRLIYWQDLAAFIAGEPDKAAINAKIKGLRASDKTSPLRGEITGVRGHLGAERQRLLDSVSGDRLSGMILAAPDDEWLVDVQVGSDEFTYIASALHLIVRVPDIARFDLDTQQAVEALQMKPAARAVHVRSVSDVAKNARLIGSAYNSRTHPDLFYTADFDMNLRFGQVGGVANRVRPYRPETLPDDFARCGAYLVREPFRAQPVRVCVVNTLNMKLADFVEAMQRQLTRGYDFSIDVVRERRIRVLSESNLESAVRVVEKEDPDIILAFFPDESEDDGDEDDSGGEGATATTAKSLTLGRALPTHVIYESTLNDPDSMSRIILSILGKTGSAPYVLAEPLEGIDRVVGLALVRDTKKTTGETRITAIARIYGADGAFIRYAVRELIQAEGESAPPYVLVRDLFPQRDFQGQRVLIHHDGPLPDDLKNALAVWAQAIKATFYPVEIYRFGAPRIYGLAGGVTQPPWGSAFKFDDTEALIVTSVPEADITPQPLRVKTLALNAAPLPVEMALRSVLVWSLLAYGAPRPPKLPVTIINVDQLAYWLRRGNSFHAQEGPVPFWL